MELPRKRIVMQMEELFCIHGASIRCTFVLLSTSMTTFVDVILLREQIMHDRWRCHKNMNWNLLAPLQFVDTHLLCVSICIALQLTNNLFKIHQAIRCCFVFFLFSEDTWDSSDHELFQIWVTWPTRFGKSMFLPYGESTTIRALPWEVNLPKNQKMVDPKMQMLGDSEDFDLASEKLGALPTKVLERGAVFEKMGSSGCFLMTRGTWKDVGASTQVGRISKCFLELIQHIKIECPGIRIGSRWNV